MTSPSLSTSSSVASPAGLVFRLTWLDFARRKDLYVVAIFMLMYVVGTISVRMIGIDRASTARFLMSLGLTLSHILAAFLAASFAARCFPEEFERGTLMPLLAKPISRSQVLAGKILACLALVLGAYTLFVFTTLVAVPTVPGQKALALVQSACLQLVSLALLGSAAMALSFWMPTVVAALVSLLWYFGWGFLANLVKQSVELRSDLGARIVERVFSCVPDATVLFHTECFANSETCLHWPLFLILLAYGAAWTAALFLVARWKFGRMRL
ncbi:ABC transporter permease subunit [Candidatus Sumerlaeota bacterium]|nr:ABC transporter permease subunit [Candidatus Sumerlaeota bacterium]